MVGKIEYRLDSFILPFGPISLGPVPDRRTSPPGTGLGSQERAGLVHQGPQAEGHLPHPQPLQPRRHSEVSHRRVLVPRLRPRQDPAGSQERHCE